MVGCREKSLPSQGVLKGFRVSVFFFFFLLPALDPTWTNGLDELISLLLYCPCKLIPHKQLLTKKEDCISDSSCNTISLYYGPILRKWSIAKSLVIASDLILILGYVSWMTNLILYCTFGFLQHRISKEIRSGHQWRFPVIWIKGWKRRHHCFWRNPFRGRKWNEVHL